MEGVVKMVDHERRFGFIRLFDAGQVVSPDYFYSENDVIGDPPERGDSVSFLLDDPPSRARKRELIAVEVERIGRADRVAVDVFEERLAEREVA